MNIVYIESDRLCQCGCNKLVYDKVYDSKLIRKPYFIHGHNNTNKKIHNQEFIEKFRTRNIGNKYAIGFGRPKIFKNKKSTDMKSFSHRNKMANINGVKYLLGINKKGYKFSEKAKLNISLAHLNSNYRISNDTRIKLSKSGIQSHIKNPNIKIKMREAAIKRIEITKLSGQPLCPCSGKYEKTLIDIISKSLGYKFLRNYRISGYFIDGYCPELNLAIEIDEYHHVRKKDSDSFRQKHIESLLNCKFLRINLPKRF